MEASLRRALPVVDHSPAVTAVKAAITWGWSSFEHHRRSRTEEICFGPGAESYLRPGQRLFTPTFPNGIGCKILEFY